MASSAAEGTASLDKALDVLDAIGAHPQGVSQAELARVLSLPRTTMYRLLATLVARGMARRDPLRHVYLLGFRCFEYARQAYAMPDLVAAASPELRALRDLTGETSYLAVLDGAEVLSLERCDGAHSHRSAAAVGQRKPLHCTSQGKAILSALAAPARENRSDRTARHRLSSPHAALAFAGEAGLRGNAFGQIPLDVAEQFRFLIRLAEVFVHAHLKRHAAMFFSGA